MTHTVTIRPYQESDYATCRQLWVELTEHHRDIYNSPSIGGDDPGSGFDEYIAHRGWIGSWVAVTGETIVGLSGLLETNSGVEVEPVVVSRTHRGEGVGRLLVETAVDAASTRGHTQVSIRPVGRNAEAIAAFHALGFTNVGHVELFMDLRSDPPNWIEGIELHGLPFRH